MVSSAGKLHGASCSLRFLQETQRWGAGSPKKILALCRIITGALCIRKIPNLTGQFFVLAVPNRHIKKTLP